MKPRRACSKGPNRLRRSENPNARREKNDSWEEVCERNNLVKAWKQVRGNKGSPGVDGKTIGDTLDALREHWPAIRDQLLQGTYRPQPVRRVNIPKPGGGVRKLGIPAVLDRLIQQAVLQVLQKRWDPTFSDRSYGFRPGRSAHQAVAQAHAYIAEGYQWVVDIDLEKFFDRVNHDLLLARVAERVADKRLLKLIRAFLTAGVMEDGLVSPVDEGTPQGGPLSPLLSNLVLDDLDRELERRGHRFCRYADDCNIYVRSRRGWRTGDGQRLPVSQAETPAHGQCIEECGGSTRRSDVPRLSLDDRRGAPAIDLAGGGAPVPGASARADEQDARDQYRADGRLLEAVSARLAKLFRLQPGPAGALQPGCADSPETPDGYLAAVGHGADPIRQFEATGRPAHASGGGRWLSHWLLGDVAPRGRPTSTAQCLLRFARPPPSRRFFGRITLPNRRGTGPVCPVV